MASARNGLRWITTSEVEGATCPRTPGPGLSARCARHQKTFSDQDVDFGESFLCLLAG